VANAALPIPINSHWDIRNRGRSQRHVRDQYGRYFLRRPFIKTKTPEINASALPAEAGLISGALSGPAKALLAKPMTSNTAPASFTEKLLLTDE